jgi:hypothetical protein
MSRFTRFALAAVTITFALSGCARDAAPNTMFGDTAMSRGYADDTIQICGEPGYSKNTDYYEVHVNGVCGKVNKEYDPTTPENRKVFGYVISHEREQLLYAAYKPFADKLLNRMLTSEIPYRVYGDLYVLPKGRLVKNASGIAAYRPAPYNGWGTIASVAPSDEGSTQRLSIELQVKFTAGRIDRSVDPLWIHLGTTHGDLNFTGPMRLDKQDNLIPNTTSSMNYFMNVWDEEGIKPYVSLIDYITQYGEPSPAYQRQLSPEDSDLTVLAATNLDPATALEADGRYRQNPTIEDIKLNDARFLEILAGVDKDGSYWYE